MITLRYFATLDAGAFGAVLSLGAALTKTRRGHRIDARLCALYQKKDSKHQTEWAKILRVALGEKG